MNENKDPKKAGTNEQENEGKNQNSHMHNHNSFGNKFTLLKIIPIILNNGIKNIKTNARLDSGSDTKLIRTDVWSKLELNGAEKKLNINNAFSKASQITSEIVKIRISSVCNAFDSSVDAYVVDNLTSVLTKLILLI